MILLNIVRREREGGKRRIRRVDRTTASGRFQNHFIQRTRFGTMDEKSGGMILITQFFSRKRTEERNLGAKFARERLKALARRTLARDTERTASRGSRSNRLVMPLAFHQTPHGKPVFAAHGIRVGFEKISINAVADDAYSPRR